MTSTLAQPGAGAAEHQGVADGSPEVRVEHRVDDGVEGGAGQGQPLDDRHHSLAGRGARGEEGLWITAVRA